MRRTLDVLVHAFCDYCSWPKKFREPYFSRNTPATEGNPNRKTSRTQKLIDHVQGKNGLTRQQDGPVRNKMTWPRHCDGPVRHKMSCSGGRKTGLYGKRCTVGLHDEQVRHNHNIPWKSREGKRAYAAKDGLKINNIFSIYDRLLHQIVSLKRIDRPD